MSIDSVGGGSRDPNEAFRARKMAEERARNMEQAEQRRQEEMQKLTESREHALVRMHEQAQNDIELKRAESQNRIEQAKSTADYRVKQFEADSQRLTEEAKKQFETKARNLQRSAGELDKQRQMLVKNHEAAMERIKLNSENTQRENIQRASLEAGKAHIAQQKRLEDINARGEAETQRIAGEWEGRKRQTASDGARQITRLQDQYRENANQIESEIAFAQRSGSEQVVRERENLAKARQQMALEADDQMSRQQFEQQRVLNRTLAEGRRKQQDVEYQIHSELSDATKTAKTRLRDTQNRAAFNMKQVQLEAEAQEAIARRAYTQQQALLNEERNRSIDTHQKSNEALHQQLSADYAARSQKLIQDKQTKLTSQLTQDETELKASRARAQKQINDVMNQNSSTVAAHGTKAADPFYRVQKLGAQVVDGEREVTVSLAVPEHEQDNIRLTYQRGNSLNLSGTRRFQSKLRTDDGHDVSTSSYQSYTESFPVSGKLEMKEMVRSYADGRLTFRIPKG